MEQRTLPEDRSTPSENGMGEAIALSPKTSDRSRWLGCDWGDRSQITSAATREMRSLPYPKPAIAQSDPDAMGRSHSNHFCVGTGKKIAVSPKTRNRSKLLGCDGAIVLKILQRSAQKKHLRKQKPHKFCHSKSP
ncbi:hypothetical protein [Halomicronema sp. CCY15110]|uniref:hypothetical protein n=1 Tax=Halomicronema sp. CCY15110 TaxID=2767773 RepID=UPI00194E9DBF|nr:hypothetical protein [Halomicronema sp. CCY15110]